MTAPKRPVTFFYARSETAPITAVPVTPPLHSLTRYLRECVRASLRAGFVASDAIAKAREAGEWLEQVVSDRKLSRFDQRLLRALSIACLRGGGASTGTMLAQRALRSLQLLNREISRRAHRLKHPPDTWWIYYLRGGVEAGLFAGYLAEDAVRRAIEGVEWLELHFGAEGIEGGDQMRARRFLNAVLGTRGVSGHVAAQRAIEAARLLEEMVVESRRRATERAKTEHRRRQRRARRGDVPS